MQDISNIKETIFSTDSFDFNSLALQLFEFQYKNNDIYKSYADVLKVNPSQVNDIYDIPFLPISFFKTHEVMTTNFLPQQIFESSGTTTSINSKHLVKDLKLYEHSFSTGFEKCYGDISEYCIIGLLPSYLERNNSSLVYMVDKLIQISCNPMSGFYLNDFTGLYHTLNVLENRKQKTILIGVTFALLDFAEQFSFPLEHTIIMETGGMKGRREELLREQVHAKLKNSFSIDTIHSEYGMTELFSQAYSKGNGIFQSPPWMKVLCRDEEDPLTTKPYTGKEVKGPLNIIDLANIYSCSFIATDDMGLLHTNNSFEVTGRITHSDIRGCSLLVV